MVYVTDTHSILWFFTDDSKLGRNSKDLFEKAEIGQIKIIIPSIVLTELMYLLEDKNSKSKFKDLLEKIKVASNYEIYPLDLDIVEEVYNITTIREIHDRIIVATAKILDCSLITKDEKIKNSGEVDCVW